DLFDTTPLLRNPVLVDYAELKRLRFNAATDPLTGLYNRRLFDEYFRRELTRSSRHAYPLALVLFDLSNFKQVNDTYGHAVGDSVLLTLARISAETIRGSDYPFRIGGDEFAVLLPQSDSQSAQTLIRRIVQKFQDQVRELVPDLELRLDYGVALFPDDGESPANLFQAADRRLYASKRSPVERESVLAVAEVPLAGARPGTEPSPSKHARLPEAGLQLRRYKRTSLKGTGAYAIVSNGFGSKATQLIDLSFDGMGILLEEVIDLPETFLARLYLPILVDLPSLPDQELTVRRVYAQPLPDGFLRVGCSFTF
ncbi:MAG: diguanylate cyclase domain-containing protein, partial [Nitrospirales bacterium]